jgi:hypothetical protein
MPVRPTRLTDALNAIRHTRATRSLLVLLVAGAASLAAAGPASAARGMEIGMEDERIMLSQFWRAPKLVQIWKDMGIDSVRLIVGWYRIAPASTRLKAPRGFDATDPAEPRYQWGSLDQAVDLLTAAGIKPMLTVTGPAPLWGTANPRRRKGQYLPLAKPFGRFATAVARRYGNRVDRWLVWNEPNQPGWLLPQRDCRGKGRKRTCTPRSPHVYRSLYNAAERAIRRADPGAQILMGELAPVGDDPTKADWRPLSPMPFLRALGCVDDRFKRIRGGRCKGFRPPRADAFGYHPHGKRRPPEKPNPDRGEAQLGDLGRLFGTLDRLTRTRRLLAPAATRRRFDVYMTEFGFQTRPPDRTSGVTLAQQARYLQQAAYILWRHPRVRNLTHYQWEDERVRKDGPRSSGFAGWQSGLHFFDGRAKPAFAVFNAPLVYDRRRAQLWGQIRPGASHAASLQERNAGSTLWQDVAQITTDATGYWTSDYPVDERADYRVAWVDRPVTLEAKPLGHTSGVLDVDAGSGRLRTSSGRGS